MWLGFWDITGVICCTLCAILMRSIRTDHFQSQEILYWARRKSPFGRFINKTSSLCAQNYYALNHAYTFHRGIFFSLKLVYLVNRVSTTSESITNYFEYPFYFLQVHQKKSKQECLAMAKEEKWRGRQSFGPAELICSSQSVESIVCSAKENTPSASLPVRSKLI